MDYLRLVPEGRTVRLLCELVRIPSVNSAFADGQGEGAVASYVEQYFRALGIAVRRDEVLQGRDNVIAEVRGSDPSRTLLLEAHMDTVQVQGMSVEPFGGKVEMGRVYGRGACDTKSSLAAMMVTLATLHEKGVVPPVNVQLAAVVDEEVGSRGVRQIAGQVARGEARYEAAIVGEPTGLRVVVAHKAAVRFHVEVRGRATHSSTPDLGVNAIEKMCAVVGTLQRENELHAHRSHPLVGAPTLCVTSIQGGGGFNTVPHGCRIAVDRRVVPGEDPREVYEETKRRIESLALGCDVAVSEPFVMGSPMETPVDERVVGAMLAAAQRHASGGPPIGMPYGSDASRLALAGVPSVVFGPGSIEQAHTRDEWVEIAEVDAAVCVLLDAIEHFKQGGAPADAADASRPPSG